MTDPGDCPHCHHPIDEHVVIIECNLIGCTCASDDLDNIEISAKDVREKCYMTPEGVASMMVPKSDPKQGRKIDDFYDCRKP